MNLIYVSCLPRGWFRNIWGEFAISIVKQKSTKMLRIPNYFDWLVSIEMPTQQADDQIGQWSIAFEMGSPCSKTLDFFEKFRYSSVKSQKKLSASLTLA